MRAFWRDSAESLAVFRIAVALDFLALRELWSAEHWASLPLAAASSPPGTAWLFALVSPSPSLVRAASILLAAALVLGVLGAFTRAAFAAATVLGLWVLAVPQRTGFTFHDHHLLWFTALLAASPSGDALSLDAWRRSRSLAGPPASPAYGVPLRIAWLLLGVIFFFPGLWKLRASGLEWIWSDNLRNQMYLKWAQSPAFVPLFRIDRYPLLCRMAALFTVIFELAFPFAVFFRRRARMVAVCAALLFHAGTSAFMNLDFSSLFACYVVFFDWAWLTRNRERAPTLERSVLPASIAGGLLLLGASIAGALGVTNAWPFACYPTFQWMAKAEMPAPALELVRVDGSAIEVPRALIDGGSQRAWSLAWSVIGAIDVAPSPDRLRAYFEVLRAEHAELDALARDAVRVRFYRASVSTIPEERDRPPISKTLIAELSIP